ncbi:VWA domain-containing protein [Legionella cardiaca]|uniref:VWA domain-containing protein n=1 Tax=Legionella cardiaca TaxID=1071983 RepID=A0ABY8AXB0_9GAMM|nr:vWA domain-containing protein [Legionella cardiaca]WED44076.1 VWA domain-containing protein [Legionella cardiaca]
MPKLADNALRAKNITSLLLNMGVELQNSPISCNGEFFGFNLQNHTNILGLQTKIQSLLQVAPAKRINLPTLITQEIDEATCPSQAQMDTHKKSCKAIFDVLQMQGLDYSLDKELEQITINLPNPYGQLFACLEYNYMHVSGNQVIFDLKKYLQNKPENLFLFEDKVPYLFAKTEAFERKQVFYAQKHSKEGIEVTPYFFIPNASCPPDYHFVLDTSTSMEGNRLETLKASVITFAKALFQFQPNAVIKITTFNSQINLLGTYNKEQITALESDVNNLNVNGNTCLYRVTSQQLIHIQESSRHNNILLFTDGQNDSYDSELQLELLKKHIHALQTGSALTTAKNKFYILNYGSQQPQALYQVTQLFDSPIIETDTPHFMETLDKHEKLQEWAALRELFECRLEVSNNAKQSKREPINYVRPFDMSGQFAALETEKFQYGDVLQLVVKDSNGHIILDDKKELPKSSVVDLSLFNSNNSTVVSTPYTSAFTL